MLLHWPLPCCYMLSFITQILLAFYRLTHSHFFMECHLALGILKTKVLEGDRISLCINKLATVSYCE